MAKKRSTNPWFEVSLILILIAALALLMWNINHSATKKAQRNLTDASSQTPAEPEVAIQIYGRNHPLLPITTLETLHLETTFTSSSTNSQPNASQLDIRIHMPQPPGRYPILILLPSEKALPDAYRPTLEYWSNFGYITIEIIHHDFGPMPTSPAPDDFKPTTQTSSPPQTQANPSSQDDSQTQEKEDYLFTEGAGWVNAPAQIPDSASATGMTADPSQLPAMKCLQIILSHLENPRSLPASLAESLDTSRIGIIGHAEGSLAAMLASGVMVQTHVDEEPPSTINAAATSLTGLHSFRDSRICAAMLLWSYGPGRHGLTEHSWDRLAIPTLFVSSRWEKRLSFQGNWWRHRAFELSPPWAKYYMSLSIPELFVPLDQDELKWPDPRMPREYRPDTMDRGLLYLQSTGVAFWDAYLTGKADAKRYLDLSVVSQISHGRAVMDRK